MHRIPRLVALLGLGLLCFAACSRSSSKGSASTVASSTSATTTTVASASSSTTAAIKTAQGPLPAPIPIAAQAGVASGLELLEATFHETTPFTLRFEQAAFSDHGGTLFAFVRNASAQPVEIQRAKLNGQDVSGIASLRWWRAWPKRIDPGQVTTVTLKAVDAPLAAGRDVILELEGTQGTTLRTRIALATPKLRLGYAACTPGRTGLRVFLRNEAPDPVEVTGLRLNGLEYLGRTRLLGGPVIPSGATAIAKVDVGRQLAPGEPLALRVRFEQGGKQTWVGAPLRAFDPWFPLGTWDSQMRPRPGRPEALPQAPGRPLRGRQRRSASP